MMRKLYQEIKNIQIFKSKWKEFLIPVILFFVFFIPTFLIRKSFLMDGDMAEYLNNPVRVFNGEMPYRDFWLLFAPGEVFFPALIYKIFGININAVVNITIFFSALCGLLSFFIVKQLTHSNLYGGILSLMVYYDSMIRYYCGPWYIHLYFFFLLVGILFFLKFLTTDRSKYLILVGLSVGIAFIFRIFETGPAFLAIMVSIWLQNRRNKDSLLSLLKKLAWFVVGILVPLMLLFFFVKDFYLNLIQSVFFDSIHHGTSMKLSLLGNPEFRVNAVLEFIRKDWISDFTGTAIAFFATFYSFLKTLVTWLTPVIVIFSAIWLIARKYLTYELKIPVVFFLIWGTLTLPRVIGRADLNHFSYAITPLFFVMILVIYNIKKYSQMSKSRGIRVIKYILSVLIMLSVLTPLTFTMDIMHILKENRYEVNSLHGKIMLSDPEYADNIKKVIECINSNTNSGDYIFVTIWDGPPFYAMAGRKNPTYYDSMIDLVIRPDKKKQQKLCYDLQMSGTKLIIHNPNLGFDQMASRQFSNTCKVIQDFIDKNYSLINQFGEFQVYRINNFSGEPFHVFKRKAE